jgi:hypothetical protein
MNLSENYAKEDELEKKISAATPIEMLAGFDSVNESIRKINIIVENLKEFACDINEIDGAVEKKEKLWSQIVDNLDTIPNALIFQTIVKLLSSLVDNSFVCSDTPICENFNDRLTKTLLPKLHEVKIISGIQLMSKRNEFGSIKTKCAEIIQTIENEMEPLFNSSLESSFQEEDDIISDFIAAIVAKLNAEGKIQFCSQNLNELKQIILNDSTMQEHEKLISDTKLVGNLIADKISQVQDNVAQMHQINERINFSKISIMRMISALKTEKNQQYNRALINQTLNSTVIHLNKSMEINLPKHMLELEEFLSQPFHNFSSSNGVGRISSVSRNENLISMLSTVTRYFTCPNDFLKFVHSRIEYRNELKFIAIDLESSLSNLTALDTDIIYKMGDKNREEILMMLDNITKNNVTMRNHLRNLHLLYEYSLENPLRKYIPRSKQIDKKSYVEYEKDYLLYYKMIQK